MNRKKLLFYIFSYCLLHTFEKRLQAQAISAGGRHSLAICADSTVVAWGYNGFGQLGNGNEIEQHSGTAVIGLTKIIHVAGGLFHSLFVHNDGSVFSCGRNATGALGVGGTTNAFIPLLIGSLSKTKKVAAGGEHSLFLSEDGSVWACGQNASGQLGDGSNQTKTSPVRISGLSDVVQLAAGAEFSLFLKSDGSVWACGHNGFGQFGNGSKKSSNVPVHINGLSGIVQISAGEWHSTFVDKDGRVYTCGRNQYGQLGDGTTTDKELASLVPGLDDILMAEAGGIHTVFVKRDGSVFACGLNSGGNNNGQLGDGTTIDRSSPVGVIPAWFPGDIIHAEATRENSLFVRSDGSLWASGRNNYGQLGIGAFSNNNAATALPATAVCKTVWLTAAEDPKEVHSINIYPNPTQNSIYVDTQADLTDVSIVVSDVSSRPIHIWENVQEKTLKLDLDLNAGMYFLKIVKDHKLLTCRKLMIQK
ncbi:MAG: T9SS type A sorting domain-containing protein [Saprospiraceae bacterium]|nr:T9SS type A sorting domain-containing protein [Saprospiraceae bacterium]